MNIALDQGALYRAKMTLSSDGQNLTVLTTARLYEQGFRYILRKNRSGRNFFEFYTLLLLGDTIESATRASALGIILTGLRPFISFEYASARPREQLSAAYDAHVNLRVR